MRGLELRRPPAPEPSPRLARLTRHLSARLWELEGMGVAEVSADQERGVVRARLDGRAEALLRALEEYGVQAGREGDFLVFTLPPQLPFEDLDYLWGALFELLG